MRTGAGGAVSRQSRLNSTTASTVSSSVGGRGGGRADASPPRHPDDAAIDDMARSLSPSPSRRGRRLKKVATASPYAVRYSETVWHAPHWKCTSSIAETQLVTCVVVCCGRIVAGRRDGTISVWDPATYRLVSVLKPGHDGEVLRLLSVRDDSLLVSVGGSSMKVGVARLARRRRSS